MIHVFLRSITLKVSFYHFLIPIFLGFFFIAPSYGQKENKHLKSIVSTLEFDCSAPGIRIERCSSSWQPKGGAESNTVMIRAYAVDPNLMGRFTFHLYDVSSEIGYCMNAPPKDDIPETGENSDSWKDLQFVHPQDDFYAPKDMGNFISIVSKLNTNEATVEIKSYDYGGYGKLRVYFKPLTGGATMPGIVEGSSERAFITIPLDEDSGSSGDDPNNIWDNAP